MIRNLHFIVAVAMATLWLAWGCQAQPSQEAVSTQKTEQTQHQTGLVTLSPESQKLAEIAVEEVEFRSLKQRLQFPGTVQVDENRLAHIGPRIPGRVVEVTAGLGDRVEPGKKLAVIDSPELGRVQSEYLIARAKLLVAEKAHERARTLLDGKVIGAGEFQRRGGDYLAAKAEAQAAEDRLHLFGMTETEVKGLGGESSIRSQVAITAPLRGTVIERHATLGEVVEPAKTLFTIADLSTLWGIAEVPEQDLAKVEKGLTVEVVVSPYPGAVFPGKVTYVSETIDPSSRTVKVRVEIDNPKGKLKPQMFATFRIILGETEKVLTVPDAAVQRDGNRFLVFVETEPGLFSVRDVTIGREVGGRVEIRKGVEPGEKVVTTGSFRLKSEMKKTEMEAG